MIHETPPIERILEEYRGASRDALIPILQRVQEAEGYLSQQAIARVGEALDLPSSKVYGVATFYNQFRFQPRGERHIMICRGTACHVKGSAGVLEKLSQATGVEPGKTSRDRKFSLEVVACMGACALAPALSVNGQFYPKVSSGTVARVLENRHDEPAPKP